MQVKKYRVLVHDIREPGGWRPVLYPFTTMDIAEKRAEELRDNRGCLTHIAHEFVEVPKG